MGTLEMTKQIVRPHRLNEFGYERSLLWSDLKTFCNSLSEEQLQNEVRVWGEEKGGGIYAISEIQDDLINPSGDGLEMKSIYTESEDKDDKEIGEEEDIVVSKGSIILELDF